MKIAYIIIQVIFLILISPLLSGLIKKIKNNIRMRKGASILQPYYNLAKLFSKNEVVSKNSSWIFSITPYMVLGSSIAALFLVPVFMQGLYLNHMGDLLLIVFILAFGRFFLSLAGLDAGSAFGGMGSSREMFISSLVEPVMLMSVFAVSISAGSTSIGAVTANAAVSLSSIIAALAFFVVLIAETSRIPVDNQETHLELTMIHEAMVLEYSARSLALIELGSHIKQILFFTILANVILPWCGFIMYAVKLIVLAFVVGVVEISAAKMRLFRVVDLLSFSFVLSVIAVIGSVMRL